MLRDLQDVGDPLGTIITGELAKRTGTRRLPEEEMEALRELLRQIAFDPENVFASIARVARDLCGADSAGVNLLEDSQTDGLRFRVVAVEGSLSRFRGALWPVEETACGHSLTAGTPQLYRRPASAFEVPHGPDPAVEEKLIAPFRRAEGAAGVLWMISHNPGPVFTAADERLLVCLGDVATATLAVTEKLKAEKLLRDINQDLERRVEVRTREVRKRSRQLGRLALQLTQAEQDERRRIARVLHDHLQQILVAAKLRLGAAKHQPGSGANAALDEVGELITHATEASRNLAVELSPPILYDSGLPAALEWLARRMKEQHGLDVELRIKDDPPLDTHVKAFLFHAARELLFNVVKHSGVLSASLEMSAIGVGRICVEVRDRGRGFPTAEWDQALSGSGFGLTGMRDRLALLGGTLIVRAGEGTGSTIMLIAPSGADAVLPETAVREEEESSLRPAESAPPSVHEEGAPRFRVLLVDDHKILRAGLAGLLREQPDMDLVAEAEDGQQAVDYVKEYDPDVVVMDISMPRLNGIEAARIISAEHPEVAVIGLSMHDKEDMANAMIEAGARAYITKAAAADHLIATIRSCFAPL